MMPTKKQIIYVHEGKFYKAVPPQQLAGYISEGYIMNVYHARSRTAFMHVSRGNSQSLPRLFYTIQSEFPDTSSLRAFIIGNAIPENLADLVKSALPECSIGTNQIADTMGLSLEFNPENGEYKPVTGLKTEELSYVGPPSGNTILN